MVVVARNCTIMGTMDDLYNDLCCICSIYSWCITNCSNNWRVWKMNYDIRDTGPYNERNEQQRAANALIKHAFSTGDPIARLGWNIATQYQDDPNKQLELFDEIANLIKKARK